MVNNTFNIVVEKYLNIFNKCPILRTQLKVFSSLKFDFIVINIYVATFLLFYKCLEYILYYLKIGNSL